MSAHPETTAARTAPVARLPLAVLGLSVLGMFVAGYLVYEHLTAAASFACPETGTINCVKVTTSTYSVFAGVPVAELGLGFFVTMTLASLPRVWHRPMVARFRLGAVTVGVLFVLYLIWAELFRVDAICLWCTAVHVITLSLFALLVVERALGPVAPER